MCFSPTVLQTEMRERPVNHHYGCSPRCMLESSPEESLGQTKPNFLEGEFGGKPRYTLYWTA